MTYERVKPTYLSVAHTGFKILVIRDVSLQTCQPAIQKDCGSLKIRSCCCCNLKQLDDIGESPYTFLSSTNKMQLYTIFVYCCRCSTCFDRVFGSSSGAQKLYMQHRVAWVSSDSPKLAVTAYKFDKYPMLHVQFLSS